MSALPSTLPPHTPFPTDTASHTTRPKVDIISQRRPLKGWKRRKTPTAVRIGQLPYPCTIGLELIIPGGVHGEMLLAYDIIVSSRPALEHVLASLRELSATLDQTILIHPDSANLDASPNIVPESLIP